MPEIVGDLGKLIVSKGFKKVSQSPINHPIWSHCLRAWLSVVVGEYLMHWIICRFWLHVDKHQGGCTYVIVVECLPQPKRKIFLKITGTINYFNLVHFSPQV